MKIEDYGDKVSRMSRADLLDEIKTPTALALSAFKHGRKADQIDMAWAPFDHINRQARIAIVGITPGREQMGNALIEYQDQRKAGVRHADALKAAKVHGAFSGKLRDLLVDLLDEIAMPTHLGLQTSRELFGARSELAHFTSCLRWPIFVNKKNYTGSDPKITTVPEFAKVMDFALRQEIIALPEDCLIVPCGSMASLAVERFTAKLPGFNRDRLILGFPHPSGAARDVSSQFLDRISATRKSPVRPEIRQRALELRARFSGEQAPEPMV